MLLLLFHEQEVNDFSRKRSFHFSKSIYFQLLKEKFLCFREIIICSFGFFASLFIYLFCGIIFVLGGRCSSEGINFAATLMVGFPYEGLSEVSFLRVARDERRDFREQGWLETWCLHFLFVVIF